MTVQRDVRLRAAQRQEVEQKIKAVEEWNKSSSRKGETSGDVFLRAVKEGAERNAQSGIAAFSMV
jgi:hypothetical protein